MSLRAFIVALLAIALAPEVVHACAMCFSGPEESRKAFAVTAAFLTLLPLGMVAGMTTWLRGRAKRADAEEAAGPPDTEDEPRSPA